MKLLFGQGHLLGSLIGKIAVLAAGSTPHSKGINGRMVETASIMRDYVARHCKRAHIRRTVGVPSIAFFHGQHAP